MTNPFIRLVHYFSTSVLELRKVTWPSRADVVRHTLVIAAAVLVTVIIVGLVDYGLTALLRDVIVNRE